MKITHPWNKTTLACSLAVLALAGQMPKGAQAAPAPKAVVVVRHGEDLSAWATTRAQVNPAWTDGAAGNPALPAVAPGWPNYALPNGTTITLQQHGLSPAGETQARFLGRNLPVIVAAFGCAEISRVVTKRPYGLNEKNKAVTPNPFDTLYPFISSEAFKAKGGDVVLINPGKGANPILDEGLVKMLNPDAAPKDSILEGTSGSTVLCWDAEGLWGEKNAEDARPFDKNSILSIMAGPALGAYIRRMDAELGGGCPGKAARIYVFVGREGTGPGTKVPQKYDCIIVDVLDPNQTNLDYALEITARLRVDEKTQNMRIMWPEVGGRDPWKPLPPPTPAP